MPVKSKESWIHSIQVTVGHLTGGEYTHTGIEIYKMFWIPDPRFLKILLERIGQGRNSKVDSE